MLRQDSVQMQQSSLKRWSGLFGVALLVLAVLAGGSLAWAEDKPPQNKPQKLDDPFGGLPDPEDLLKQFQGQIDPDLLKLMQQQMEMTRRMLEQMRQRIPNARRGMIQPLPFPNVFPALPERGRPRNLDDRLGARVEPPSSALVDQLDLPRGQGMVLLDLKGDSPASRAGLKNNDILLELDGQPVPSDPAKFAEFMARIKADEPIDAVVLRKTRKETIKGVKLPKADKREVEQPMLPEIPLPNLKLLPLPPLPIAGGAGLSLRRVNDDFTATEHEGSTTLTVIGKVNNGKAELQKVVIKEDQKTTEYQKIEDVPAGQREKVEKLLRMAEGKPIQLNLGIE